MYIFKRNIDDSMQSNTLYTAVECHEQNIAVSYSILLSEKVKLISVERKLLRALKITRKEFIIYFAVVY